MMPPEVPLYLNAHTGQADGYCKLVETWGSDERIVESARMSTDGAFRGWGPFACVCSFRSDSPGPHTDCPKCKGEGTVPGDEKLLRFMYENAHASPFEFAGMSVEFQVPIFIIRQIHRHRAAGYSELSARYTEMPDLFWLPPASEIRRQGGSNKQGSLTDGSAEWARVSADVVSLLARTYEGNRRVYEELLALGVAKEQARAVLPVAQFTRCRMTSNLRMVLHFLGLRLDAHAQPEIRQLAEAIAGFARSAFPRTLALFDEGRA